MSKKYIPLSVPNLNGNELKYVSDALNKEWVSTSGSYVNDFERKVAEYAKCKGAVSCQNGTSGLHTALLVCGVTKEDEVIVPTLTFIASVNPVRYIGAEPIFMDCDSSLNMDVYKLKKFCEQECIFIDSKLINITTKKHVKALIIVHVFGNMADMEEITEVAKRYNLKVIEDAAEAMGTYYTEGKFKNKHAGTIGDIGVYSFNGNKIITTGGGGMIISDNEKLLVRAKHLTTQAKLDEVYYTHDEVGYNYRMTNFQAALGLAQLEQLEDFIKIKKDNYEYYKSEIDKIPELDLIRFNENIRPNYWFYALYLGQDYELNRDQIIKYLSKYKIQVRPIWGLISEQKPYKDSQTYNIDKAKHFLDRIINIPCSSSLSKEDAEYVIECLKKPEAR